MNKEKWWVKCCIHDARRIILTNNDVICVNKLINHFSDNDKWYSINTREIASIIDNVITGREKEKEYNKIVEEVVIRLEENNLY